MVRAPKRNPMYKSPLRTLPKTSNRQVSRTFCSSWSLVVVVHLYRATRQSLLFFPQSRLLYASVLQLIIYYSITADIDPPQILLHSDSGIPASPFFASFWSAVDGRALSALDRTAASAAFLSALLECTAFVVRRVRDARYMTGGSVYNEDAEKELVRAQYTRAWEESTSRKLRVEEGVAGELVAKSLVRLNRIDPGIRVPLRFVGC